MHAARTGSCVRGGLFDWRSSAVSRLEPGAQPVSQAAVQPACDPRSRGSVLVVARATRASEWECSTSASSSSSAVGAVSAHRQERVRCRGGGVSSHWQSCGRHVYGVSEGSCVAVVGAVDGIKKSGKGAASFPPIPDRGQKLYHVDAAGRAPREVSSTSASFWSTARSARLGADTSTEDDVGKEAMTTVIEENGDGAQNKQRVMEAVAEDALYWAALNGLVVGDGKLEESMAPGMGMVHVPVTLLPSPFPRALFKEAIAIAPLFNDLVDRISQDADFLQHTLESASRSDAFTTKLLQIHSTILAEGITQDIRLGLHRSDYMLHHSTNQLLQVELNTISVSFAGLGSQVSKLHKHLVEKNGSSLGIHVGGVPENGAADALAEGLATAWKEYGDDSTVVMVVVQPGERNMYDQQWIMQKLWDSHGVRFIRRTLKEIYSGATLDHNGSLIVDGQVVSIVYFRAGYAPTDYPSEVEWGARLLMERSKAIKCPSISYHLAGAKKIQQELARPGVLQRLLGSLESASLLQRFFAGLWSLEGQGSEEIISEAIKKPHRFVLKPQREGGGNNLYGDSLREKLIELRDDGEGHARGAYILMQRIEPLVQTSYLMRRGQWGAVDTLSELGIFSTYVRNGDKVVLNKAAGHLLRTKAASSDEGGVAAGFAVLDSPYFV